MPAEPVDQWHHEVLTASQRLALQATGAVFSQCPGSFLAGGTALALRFGHRRSRDLDWFVNGPFDHLRFAQELTHLPDSRVIHAEPGTIHAEVNDIAVSLIRYSYVTGLIDHCAGTPVASLRTAAGMKLLAIVNRGYKRDFIDVAAILSHGTPLVRLIEWAMADIPGLTMESLLRSLAWRGDADVQPEPDGVTVADWRRVTQSLDAAIQGFVEG